MRTLLVLAAFLAVVATAAAATPANVTFLGSQTADQLNYYLNVERKFYFEASHPDPRLVLPDAIPAKYAVDIYRIAYTTTITTLGNKPTIASGLIAIPKDTGSTHMNLYSYQHGTVAGKYEVPSYAFSKENPSGIPHYDDAYEARFEVAQLGGQGYVVIAADYLGMGDNNEGIDYMVRETQQQTTVDLFEAAMAWLPSKGISVNKVFLGGSSQGGYVTMDLLQGLESRGVEVAAASPSCNPTDLFAAMSLVIFNPPPLSSPLQVMAVAFSSFALQHYYNLPNLVAQAVKPEYAVLMKRLATFDYKTLEERNGIIGQLVVAGKGNLKNLLNEQAADPSKFVLTDYGQGATRSQVYKQIFKTPTYLSYGTLDEVVAPAIGQLAYTLQQAMGSNSISLHSVEYGNHRGTWMVTMVRQVAWFAQHSD